MLLRRRVNIADLVVVPITQLKREKKSRRNRPRFSLHETGDRHSRATTEDLPFGSLKSDEPYPQSSAVKAAERSISA